MCAEKKRRDDLKENIMGAKKFFILTILILIILFSFLLVFSRDGQDARKRQYSVKEKFLILRQKLEKRGYTSTEILKSRFDRLPYFTSQSKIIKERSEYFSYYHFQKPRSFMDIPDFQVNQEEDSATFKQLLPAVLTFQDYGFLAVWEDERNGDWEIFSQKIDSGGVFADTNIKIITDSLFSNQVQPDVAGIGDSSFVLVWLDGWEYKLFAQVFKLDSTPLTGKIEVSQDFCYTPEVSSFDDSTFVVVWKDESDDVYARRYNFSGIPFGPSFKVNDSGLNLRFSPSVDVDSDSGFVVVWEDYRDLDGDVYFQRYTYGGSPLGSNIQANVDSGMEDQYQPEVGFGKDGEFMVSWVDTKENNPDIYAKIFFWNGSVKRDGFKVNTDEGSDDQWDPCLGSYSYGKYFVSWTDLRNGWDIYAQLYDSAGQRIGPNFVLSDTTSLGIRDKVKISLVQDGFCVACWEDERKSNNDIYCQRITEGSLQGSNLKVNLDSTGAMQNSPALATDKEGGLMVCWEDKRRGKSDIYVKKYNRWGTEIFPDKKVNDNLSLVEQKSPDISVSDDGDFVIVWEDSRDGLDVYAQLFGQFGNPEGGNFQVSSDTLFSFCVTPSVAKFSDGDFVVVWSGEKSGTRDVYAKRYDQAGAPQGSSFKVNDDVEDVNHLNPKVVKDSLSNFLVAWYDERGSKKRIYLQRFDSSGAPIGTNFALDTDSVDSKKQSFDLGMNRIGDFVVVWKSQDSSESVKAQVYDSSGIALGPNIFVSDDTTSRPESPKVYMDPDSYFVVVWTDYRQGEPNIYYQIFEHDGTKINNNVRLNQQSPAIQKTPDVSQSMSYIYS
ncbi:MAG: hypothetical protein AMJ90_06245, partial [candidate division Zixibacteria bacterium SM23_73_2]